MVKLFDLTVIGPDSILYKGKVSALFALFAGGSGQVLADHATFAALTRPGDIKFYDREGKTIFLSIPAKGLFHFLNNKSTLIFSKP
jgi:hypothetical protein